MRQEAKVKIMDKLVRKHQPQEDVDTIRSMINKYGEKWWTTFTMIIVSMFTNEHQRL